MPDDRDLRSLLDATVAHYERRAAAFWVATRDHDVRQNRDSLLAAIESPPPYTLLDVGCGPGRDLKAFVDAGHRVVGVEGAAAFVTMARAYSGCEVWCQDFLALDLPTRYFDGIFANASLFHIPRAELPPVLGRLYASLKPRGVLFSSNPCGQNEEGFDAGRYGVFHDWDGWRRFVEAAGFVALSHYYRPADLPPAQQSWLASLWRRP